MRSLALRKQNPTMPISVQLIGNNCVVLNVHTNDFIITDSSWKAHVEDNSIVTFALDEVKMVYIYII